MSAREPCPGRCSVGRVVFVCTRSKGHPGPHLAPIVFNAVECEMGWKDSDAQAWRARSPSGKERGE